MNVIHENVLIEIPKAITEKNGILLPVEEKNENEGVIVKFGEDVPFEVKAQLTGEPKVLYKEYYAGGAATINGKDYLIMSYKDILLIL